MKNKEDEFKIFEEKEENLLNLNENVKQNELNLLLEKDFENNGKIIQEGIFINKDEKEKSIIEKIKIYFRKNRESQIF